MRFERTASLPLKESGLPVAYRAAMARAGFEPAAFRGLSPDGLPVAYRAEKWKLPRIDVTTSHKAGDGIAGFMRHAQATRK